MNEEKIRYKYFGVMPGEIALPILGNSEDRRISDDKDFPHFHKYIEIGYCHSGKGKMILGEKIYEYKKNDFTFIPSNFPHSTLILDGTEDFWEYLFFDSKTFLKEMYKEDPQLAKKILKSIESKSYFFHLAEYEILGNLILALLENYRNKKELYKESAKGLFLALAVEIVRLNEECLETDNFIHHETKSIFNSIHYIEENFSQQLKVSDMSNVCHLSETHFRRLFKQHMEISPCVYLNLVRVDATCKLLENSETSIREVAFQCGFLTLASFNKNFKQVTGITPSEWRKRIKKEKSYSSEESIGLFNSLKHEKYYGRLK